MIAELLVMLLVLGGGCALLRTAGVRDWGLLPLGFLAGVCLMVGVGFVQVATGLPTAPPPSRRSWWAPPPSARACWRPSRCCHG